MEGAVRGLDELQLFTLRSRAGVEVTVSSFGAVITSIRTPDRVGHPGDVALGHDSIEPYFTQTAYLGALVGRYANRIAMGRFPIDGRTVQLAQNDGVHHLHGGTRGFDKQRFHAEPLTVPLGEGVRLRRTSPDGEEQYPGDLTLTVDYLLTPAGELRLSYTAETTAPTIVNITQHTYFNLSASARTVDDHLLTLNASQFTPVDEQLIPTGAFLPVDGTPFDFRRPRLIGDALREHHEQLRFAGGFDHNFVVDRGPHHPSDITCVHAARVLHEASGRVLDVYTDQPGLQFYSGNFLEGSIVGRHGAYHRGYGFCLETQRFPDTPNRPEFGSALLRPGEQYRATTILAFGVEG